MFLKKIKKYGQAKRPWTFIDNKLFKFKKFKQFSFYKKENTGRSNLNFKKTVFSKTSKKKKKNLTINNYIKMPKKLGFIFLIKFDSKLKKKINYVFFSNGILTLLPNIFTLNEGLLIRNYNYLSMPYKFFLGDKLPLYYCKNGFIINHINFNFKSQAVKSVGTLAKILFINYLTKKALVELPSKKKKLFSIFIFVVLGQNSGLLFKKLKIISAGFYKKLGKAPKVRGVAKNPVDHPNGGKTKKKKLWKTPWGKNAKK